MKNDLVERLRTEGGYYRGTFRPDVGDLMIAAAEAIEALTLRTPTREEVAEALAGHFGVRPWDDVPPNKRALKILASSNKAYSFSEDTKEDFLAAADAILQLIGKFG